MNISHLAQTNKQFPQLLLVSTGTTEEGNGFPALNVLTVQ